MSSRNYALKGETRDRAGKGVARALRRDNLIPGVIYGDGKTPVSVTLPSKEINLEYKKGHMYTSLCNLSVGGADNLVLARDIQLHPVTDVVTHIDFLRVTPKTKLHVQIPLKFINAEESPGLTTEKGVLNISLHDLDLVCQATEIPDHIDIDLTGLSIGDSIHLSDLKLPPGAQADSKRDITIASIAEPRRIIEEAPPAAEGEGTEGAAAEGEKAEGAEVAAAAPAEKQGGKGKKE
jgi:large subunit ribosomal protein L25